MSLKLNTVVVGSLRPTPPQLNILILNSRSSHRLWRRPSRRKRSTYLVIRSSSSSSHQLSSSSYSSSSSSSSQDHNLFHTFLSQLNSLDLLAPALGFTSALAILYNSTRPHLSNGIGDWNLFTSPTPFNRFVKLRCESLLLEDSTEKLIKEEGHLVCFDSGPIQQTAGNENYYTRDFVSNQLSYQRICVKTDDGGVVSLDWPANLDLTNEHGLDTTILIVPGTTDGSRDENVMSFVYECLKRGCFPIVMNPRGCARSPITTPRLFTAADSDDVYTAVQFVNKARPWTTLMGVGLGYGANMLTKYLAEVGEETPLTAATCLDNPFDLKRATESPDHLYVNQNLTDGLIDMLKSNKELFQGRSKGFDTEKALQAKSLKEFDEAISMVSYGFDKIEEFHVNSSTRDIVGKIKIPLLFIQNDVVSSFSLPRGLIAENPYTSLITCTFQLNDKSNTGTSAVPWCQHLVVEWLTAVELGLLKGRHPLLEDTDVTISPSKRVKLMESKPSHFDDLDANISYPSKKMLKTNDAYLSSVDLQKFEEKDRELKAITNGTGTQTNDANSSSGDLQKFEEKDRELKAITNGTVTQTNDTNSSSGDLQKFEEKDKELKTITNGTVAQTNLVDTELAKEGDIDLADIETGKMLQATKVVMNMLDVTMPEALSEEQKEKVLTAIGQGETLMNALQGAVPEDVRGKLTSAVTGILQSQKKILNGLSSISKIPDVTPVLNTKIQEKPGPSSQVKEPRTSEHTKGDTSLPEDSNNHPSKNDASSGVAEHEAHGGNISNSAMKSHEELGSNNQSADFSKEKTAQSSHIDDSDSSAATDVSSKVKTSGSSGDQVNEQVKPGHEGEKPGHEADKPVHEADKPGHVDDKPGHEPETKEKVNQQKEETNAQNPNDQKSITTPVTEESSSTSASSPEDGENQKKEESSAQPVPSNAGPNPPSFSVTHALDALTGMDDSTQLAVNSVFSVIEDVITQLEGSKDDDPAIDEKNEVEDTSTDSEKKHQTDSEFDLQQKKDEGSNITTADFSKLSTEKKEEAHNKDDIQHSIAKLPYRTSLYDRHVQSHLLSNVKDVKSLDSDAGSPLFLDYVPEEGQWKLLGKSGDGDDDVDDDNDVIEPAYVILDSDGDWDNELVKTKDKLEIGDDGSMVLMQHVKENLLKSLKVEVCRRIDATDMVDMAPTLKKELEHVANAISVAVVNEKQSIISWDGEDLFGPGNPHAERILDAITSAVQGTRYMKKVIPVGIVVGSSLASLKKVFNIAAADSIGTTVGDQAVADEMPLDKIPNKKVNSEDDEYEQEDVSSSLGSDTAMVGAVTAALGASALLVNQQGLYGDGLESSISSLSSNQKEKHGEPRRLEENSSKSSDDNIVTSLAEKAMMVAGPVMPMKEGGEVDQDRLVAMLADLGQRGGILRLVGKLALLWGGLRGAMSLIGKLISFLHLSERPLFQRILGFVSLVLVLWMPVVVPLLPTLVQNWAAHNSSGFAELACIIGLYSSVMVLVVLWGKRIRGYEDPFERYGIKLTSTTQMKNLLFGLIGGVTLVSLIQFTNMSLGFVSISWSATTPSSADPVTLLKLSGYVLKIAGQGLITATAIALVEELVFRSWLPEEIGTDLGYNQGIILSALAFSISQWSLKAIPGLWLLSLGLAGVRQRCQGSLSLPIGLRAGIMASSFVLKEGGYLIFRPNYPSWVIDGGDPFQPFNSVAGLALALLWAVILYPKRPLKENINVETENTPL